MIDPAIQSVSPSSSLALPETKGSLKPDSTADASSAAGFEAVLATATKDTAAMETMGEDGSDLDDRTLLAMMTGLEQEEARIGPIATMPQSRDHRTVPLSTSTLLQPVDGRQVAASGNGEHLAARGLVLDSPKHAVGEALVRNVERTMQGQIAMASMPDGESDKITIAQGAGLDTVTGTKHRLPIRSEVGMEKTANVEGAISQKGLGVPLESPRPAAGPDADDQDVLSLAMSHRGGHRTPDGLRYLSAGGSHPSSLRNDGAAPSAVLGERVSEVMNQHHHFDQNTSHSFQENSEGGTFRQPLSSLAGGNMQDHKSGSPVLGGRGASAIAIGDHRAMEIPVSVAPRLKLEVPLSGTTMLHLDVSVQQRHVSASMLLDHPMIRHLAVQQVFHLEEQLGQAGLHLQEFEASSHDQHQDEATLAERQRREPEEMLNDGGHPSHRAASHHQEPIGHSGHAETLVHLVA